MKNIINLDNNILIPHYDRNNGVGATNFFLMIDNEMYYAKKSNYNEKELVISEFCHLLNIPCVEYDLALKKGEYYVISKSFHKDGCKYISGKSLIKDFIKDTNRRTQKGLGINRSKEEKLNNLELIWLSLSRKYRLMPSKYNDIRNVMLELLKQYFLMILVQDVDYHWANWELEESKDHIKLAPKYDNEGAFGGEFYGVAMGVDGDDPFQRTTDSISRFLNITANEDNDIFLELFKNATPELFKMAINIVKTKYGIDTLSSEKIMLERYTEQYNRIEDLLKEKGLAR